MPEPNHDAAQLNLSILALMDRLRNQRSDNPEVRELLQLDRVPPGISDKRWLRNIVYQIGQGTHDPEHVDVKQMLIQGFDYMAELRAKHDEMMPPPPPRPVSTRPKMNFDFLK